MQVIIQLIQLLFGYLSRFFATPAPSFSVPKIVEKVVSSVEASVVSTAKFFAAIYETQRDNVISPSYTCCVTSVSMVLQSLALAVYGCSIRFPRKLEDWLLKDVLANCDAYSRAAAKDMNLPYLAGMPFDKLREDFYFWAWYAKSKYGIECKVEFMTPAQLHAAIMAGTITTPVAHSTARGLTSFGHIVVARGAYEDHTGKYLSENDPFGTYPYGSRTNGEGVSYNLNLWKQGSEFVVFAPVNWPGKK